jgi:tRNA(Arg) A34 adenosine deaminase TadA
MQHYMHQAINEAKAAAMRNEVPVGAVLVEFRTGTIFASAGNTVLENNDPTAHAEINVIRIACRQKLSTYLDACDIYVTLEPCAMCAQAISNARIRRIYYGAYDPKSGGVDHGARVLQSSSCHHKPDVYGGIMESDCGSLLTAFFKSKR